MIVRLRRRATRLVPIAIVALAACSRQEAPPAARRDAHATPAIAVTDDPRIACARGGEALRPRCTVDRQATADGTVLVLRHPDGGFRRLLIARDGRGVVAADGAAPVRVSVVGPALIEVAVADDRYRLPATIGP